MRIIIIFSLLISGCKVIPVKCSSFVEREIAMLPCQGEQERLINNMIYCDDARKKDPEFRCTLKGPDFTEEQKCFSKNLHGADASCAHCVLDLFGYGIGGDCGH